jgi:hypothetical protein
MTSMAIPRPQEKRRRKRLGGCQMDLLEEVPRVYFLVDAEVAEK